MLDPATLPKVDVGALNILIALPCYGGQSYVTHNRSLRGLVELFKANGVRHQIAETLSESLIPRARNAFANICCWDKNSLGERFTHVLFLDVDIGFNPNDIISAIWWDKDIVALPYPCKTINWSYIVAAVKRGVEDPIALSRMGSRPIVNSTEAVRAFNVDEPTDTFPQLGTGILLIKREVFEKMAEDDRLSIMSSVDFETTPAWQVYLSDHPGFTRFEFAEQYVEALRSHPKRKYRLMEGEKLYGPRDYAYDFFQIGINPETRYYDSEDYRFCLDAKALGFNTWLLPWAVTSHTGMMDFWMDMKAQAQVGIPAPDILPPSNGFVPMTI